MAVPFPFSLVYERAATHLMLRLRQEAVGRLSPIWAGLANGARTTRLPRGVATLPGVPTDLEAANKTGSLAGVRNDVVCFSLDRGPGGMPSGGAQDGLMVVSVLTDQAGPGPEVEERIARFGAALAQARWCR